MFFLIYLLIGVLVILFEAITIEYGRRNGDVERPASTKERICEIIAYFTEIFIWPRQVFVMVKLGIKFFKMVQNGASAAELEKFADDLIDGTSR